MSVQGDVAAYLATLGLGVLNRSIYIDETPDQPDALISVNGYAGLEGDLTHDGGWYERPRFQITVRDRTDTLSLARIETVYTALGALANVTLNGQRYLQVKALQTPFRSDKDRLNRVYYAFNCQVQRPK